MPSNDRGFDTNGSQAGDFNGYLTNGEARYWPVVTLPLEPGTTVQSGVDELDEVATFIRQLTPEQAALVREAVRLALNMVNIQPESKVLFEKDKGINLAAANTEKRKDEVRKRFGLEPQNRWQGIPTDRPLIAKLNP